MDDIASRIKELISDQGLSNTEFAKRADLNPAIISHITSGRNKPSLQVINSIKSAFTNVNLDYLVTGSGELYNDFTNVNKEQAQDNTPPAPAPSLPPEGLRPVSVPDIFSSGPEPKAEEIPPPSPPENDEQTNKTKQKEDSPAQPAGNKEIEQIVIFYNDGSFKAYRP